MAAAKPENLSLVVHGPGDLRLVKREGEWGPPGPCPTGLGAQRGPARRLQRGTRPVPRAPRRSDPGCLPRWGEGEVGG